MKISASSVAVLYGQPKASEGRRRNALEAGLFGGSQIGHQH